MVVSELASRPECLHNVSMPNVLIRDVPDDVHGRLQARADEHGQSLQQYLAGELRRLAERPSMDEVLARIATRRGGRVGLEQAVQDLTADRDRR
jgi:plasmid stability protein